MGPFHEDYDAPMSHENAHGPHSTYLSNGPGGVGFWQGKPAEAYHTWDAPIMAAEDKAMRRAMTVSGAHVLDVGCGDPERVRGLVSSGNYVTSIDTNVVDPAKVVKLDIRDAYSSHFNHLFDLIICCRVFCNIPRSDHEKVVGKLAGLLSSKGVLLILDGWDKQREAVQDARRKSGWDVLPDSPSGSRCIPEETELQLRTKLAPVGDEVLAPYYTVWTRLAQKNLLPDSNPMRFAYPMYPWEVVEKFGFYRAKSYAAYR